MKKTYTLLLLLLATVSILAQAPEKMSYQAILRDASNTLFTNQEVGMQISILESTITGTAVYTETQTATTNINGLVSIAIGSGTSSDTFSAIDWSAGPYFIKTATDPSGGSSYTITGTSQIMSVPFAMYATTSGSAAPGPQGALGIQGESGVQGAAGAQGIQGATGTSGAPGVAGTNGVNGTNGTQGPVGDTGAAGTDGQDGVGIAQTLTISGDTLFVSSGNYVLIPGLRFVNSLILEGCTDPTALNYDDSANVDDGTCIAVVNGCTDVNAFNYDASANTDDGSCASAIGDTYQGGIIFSLNGDGGLIAAPTDQSTSSQWGCSETNVGAAGTAVGTGNQNTIDIEAGCIAQGTAADISANLSLGGYNDWFLPSRGELNLMYQNIGQGNELGLGNIGNFTANTYWSSTEYDSLNAWSQAYYNGDQFKHDKGRNLKVRSVRTFGNTNGCTDPAAFNYNASANTDNGSCIAVVNGCTDNTAFNYDATANTDDGSCVAVVAGCTDSAAFNYDVSVNTDNGSCIAVVNGCTDNTAFNYHATANTDDGSCVAVVAGCTDSAAFNYDVSVNTDNGSCIAVVNGCTDDTAFNYDATANTDDGSCTAVAVGDTYQGGTVFWLDGDGRGLIAAPTDQSTSTQWGCSETNAGVAGAAGTAVGTGSQNTADIEAGCTVEGTAADICANLTLGGYSDWFLPSKDELNKMYINLHSQGIGGFSLSDYWSSTESSGNPRFAGYQSFFNAEQSYSNKSTGMYVRPVRAFGNINGCTDVSAFNYDTNANMDDGSCVSVVNGCTSIFAINYDASANIDDGSCIIKGCTDATATNYSDIANTDDGSCIIEGCTNENAFNYNPDATINNEFCVIKGCTSDNAFNYDPDANTNDGSCASGIGDTYQGGVIFWLDGDGGGLIAAPSDQADEVEWGCNRTYIYDADGTAIGTGSQNTTNIVEGCSDSGAAAYICANLTLGGYSDWFLPSKDELNEMYKNREAIGGFSTWYYMSSTQKSYNYSWYQSFRNGNQDYSFKTSENSVRAIRAF